MMRGMGSKHLNLNDLNIAPQSKFYSVNNLGGGGKLRVRKY